MSGPEAFSIMHNPDYAINVVVAMRRLKKAHFDAPPGMPWIFLNGDLLHCGSKECTAIRTPEGDQPLDKPGSLLFLACSKLDPMPEICQEVHQSGRRSSQEQEVDGCESCAEVGVLRFDSNRRALQLPFHVFAIAGGVIFAVIFGVVWLRRGPRCWISGSVW
jgi:hypothetical protein